MLEIHLKNNEVLYIKNFSSVKCYFEHILTNVEKKDIAELTLHDEDNTYTFCGDTTVVLSGKEISYLVIA